MTDAPDTRSPPCSIPYNTVIIQLDQKIKYNILKKKAYTISNTLSIQ